MDRVIMHILRCGHIPAHVAFIMDGNRRFARSNAMDTSEGHSMGFERMMQVLFWCQLIGVREVTVYAFRLETMCTVVLARVRQLHCNAKSATFSPSIENFKRPPEEVSALLSVALERCWTLIRQKEILLRLGIRIKVVGKLSMLPNDLQMGMKQLMEATENSKAELTLTLSMAYTSREEITHVCFY